MRYGLLGIILIGLVSCGGKSKVPSGTLKPEEMQAVLWDMARADAYTNDFISKDTSKNAVVENAKLQQQIFLIHNTTKEAYLKSFDYYVQKPELMKAILDTITARVGRRKSRVDTGNTGGLKLSREQ